VSTAIHLRHEFPFGTQSIGHLIRDNLQHLVHIPQQFGSNSTAYSWVTWPRDTGNRPNELTHAQGKYSQLVSNRHAMKWPQLVEKCIEGTLGGGAHALTATCCCWHTETMHSLHVRL
jgi:hypothetical protein